MLFYEVSLKYVPSFIFAILSISLNVMYLAVLKYRILLAKFPNLPFYILFNYDNGLAWVSPFFLNLSNNWKWSLFFDLLLFLALFYTDYILSSMPRYS